MAYPKLNSRSIRLFAATPEDIERKRPNLNAPYFRINRAELDKLLSYCGDADPIVSLSIWKRKGQDGKPDYFTAELSYPEGAEAQNRIRTKDDEWLSKHPRTAVDSERKRQYAINKRAAENIGVSDADDMPF